LSFADIVGQTTVVSALEKSLATGSLHHAYLFSGARGTGKTSVARILAHAANDFKYELETIHPDIIEIDAASNTGVDNIRELIERAALSPTAGRYKVYIIDEVHMLSKSAFNALLKTLEEPPASVIFILATTDPEKVPMTILSRVQHLKFGLASTEVISQHLRGVADKEKIKIADSALEFLAESSGGSFRDAMSLLEQAYVVCGGKTEIKREALEKAFGAPSNEMLTELLRNFVTGGKEQVAQLLERGIDNKKSFIEGLARQILRAPTVETLALLDDLINTLKNPAIDPNLQIRLVFLKHLTASPFAATTIETGAALKSDIAASAPLVYPEPGQQAEISVHEPKIAKSAPASELEPKEVTPEAEEIEIIDGKGLGWPEALEEIKRSDIGLWAVLAKRQVKVSSKAVLVYAEKPLWADKLEKADNFAKISRLIAPKALRITLDKAPPSEEAKKVSAKLGMDASELREVEVPDGI